MEFFDFAGADPEEKALALDALSRTETVEVCGALFCLLTLFNHLDC